MDLLALLRQRTRVAHERLDAALDFRTPGSVTRQRYAALLRATLRVVAPLEHAIAAWLTPLPGPARASCLRADLSALGQPESATPWPAPAPTSLAEAYGCAYVMEGSTLGGLAVATMVQRDLGPAIPVSYLALRGRGTRRAWESFLHHLGAFGERSDPDEREAAAEIAVGTFEAYAASLRDAGIARQAA